MEPFNKNQPIWWPEDLRRSIKIFRVHARCLEFGRPRLVVTSRTFNSWMGEKSVFHVQAAIPGRKATPFLGHKMNSFWTITGTETTAQVTINSQTLLTWGSWSTQEVFTQLQPTHQLSQVSPWSSTVLLLLWCQQLPVPRNFLSAGDHIESERKNPWDFKTIHIIHWWHHLVDNIQITSYIINIHKGFTNHQHCLDKWYKNGVMNMTQWYVKYITNISDTIWNDQNYSCTFRIYGKTAFLAVFCVEAVEGGVVPWEKGWSPKQDRSFHPKWGKYHNQFAKYIHKKYT